MEILYGWTLQNACSCPSGAVFGVHVCASGIFREAHGRHPFGNAGRGRNKDSSGFMSQSERLPLKAGVEANKHCAVFKREFLHLRVADCFM